MIRWALAARRSNCRRVRGLVVVMCAGPLCLACPDGRPRTPTHCLGTGASARKHQRWGVSLSRAGALSVYRLTNTDGLSDRDRTGFGIVGTGREGRRLLVLEPHRPLSWAGVGTLATARLPGGSSGPV